MDFGIAGKITLVTAASRGLGRGCAEQLAAEKCRVAICSRDAAGVKQAAEDGTPLPRSERRLQEVPLFTQ